MEKTENGENHKKFNQINLLQIYNNIRPLNCNIRLKGGSKSIVKYNNQQNQSINQSVMNFWNGRSI